MRERAVGLVVLVQVLAQELAVDRLQVPDVDLGRVRVARDEHVERRVLLRAQELELVIVAVDLGRDGSRDPCSFVRGHVSYIFVGQRGQGERDL